MPRLSCTVSECTHNKENLCCLDAIKVGNVNATTTCQTECDSFSHKDDVVKKIISSVERPVNNLYIECDAKECMYNENRACNAASVNIGGNDCCTCSDTQCDTFKTHNN